VKPSQFSKYLNALKSDIPENIKVHLYKYPDQIEKRAQIEAFLKPIQDDDIKCKPSIYPPESPKELRCRLPKIHTPEENIK
jgi:hypothetical protein